MTRPLLVLGNKNLSSWSMRPWLAMKVAGVDFDERVLLLDTPAFKADIEKYSAARKVPVLVHGDVTVWESLAICEYVFETWAPSLWPSDRHARAVARAVSHEMHAGFVALRSACSMNLREDRRGWEIPEAARLDAERILAIWRDCRRRFGAGGPFLFGAFSIADAMYAPVTARFVTYGLPADEEGQRYIAAVQALPAFVAWKHDALAEPA